MAEDPIKLFASRAERLPQPDDEDKTRAALEKIVEQVPVLGPAAVYILNQFLVPAQQRRLDEWLKGLADDLEDEKRRNAAFQSEHAFESEPFITATLQATRIAVNTHQHEKRVLLRNALLNIATGRAPGEDKQHIYLRLIDEFTPSHVKALNFIWRGFQGRNLWEMTKASLPGPRNYGNAIQIVVPELKGQTALIQLILGDLRNRGLSNLNGSEILFPQPGTLPVTDSGIEFLRFVLSEEELPK